MAIEIRSVLPASITQIDRAPKPASRIEPEAMPPSKLQTDAPAAERRRNPERRRRRAGKGPMDRRLGAERRRNRVDIEV